jgi:bifunctional non-homologous end joining protein LigD
MTPARKHPLASAIHIPDADSMGFELTHLDKVFFPKTGQTKGDLLRYYAAVARAILPAVRDRPLALKRYPDGVGGPFFFQQKPPAAPPPSVRVETLGTEQGKSEQARVIGGSLATLLYTIQLGCIGVDAWLSRVPKLDTPDYLVIDLDPPDKAAFQRVVVVARWVKDVLDDLGLHGIPKTSGAHGIHVYVPLPARCPQDLANGAARGIAERVAANHPREATVQREISRRKNAVYIDAMQNARGKTVAAPYCVRAVPDARVSTPLEWDELTDTLDRGAFTIETVPARLDRVGDLWAAGVSRRNALTAVRRASGDATGRRSGRE